MEKNPEHKGKPDPSELQPREVQVPDATKQALGEAAVKGSGIK